MKQWGKVHKNTPSGIKNRCESGEISGAGELLETIHCIQGEIKIQRGRHATVARGSDLVLQRTNFFISIFLFPLDCIIVYPRRQSHPPPPPPPPRHFLPKCTTWNIEFPRSKSLLIIRNFILFPVIYRNLSETKRKRNHFKV